jgi:hypothetical protein
VRREQDWSNFENEVVRIGDRRVDTVGALGRWTRRVLSGNAVYRQLPRFSARPRLRNADHESDWSASTFIAHVGKRSPVTVGDNSPLPLQMSASESPMCACRRSPIAVQGSRMKLPPVL